MNRFTIERRQKAVKGVFFPESITKERQSWGMTHAGTKGYWNSYRLVTGHLSALNGRVDQIALEYDSMRRRMPQLDTLRLFESAPQVRGTGLEYYDYAGRIDTISRESVIIQSKTGRRTALNRDVGVGFRGIITRTEQPWSMEQYAMNTLIRCRIRSLNIGIPLPRLSVEQPWRLRDALERELESLLHVAWVDYQSDNTVEKLNVVIGIDRLIREYTLGSLDWLQHLGIWEHMKILPFPDRSVALKLWMEDKMPTLTYDETEPWWIALAQEAESEVTAFRRAYMSNGRVTITITTNPQLHELMHPTMNVTHHMITYGPHKEVGVAIETQDEKTRGFIPYVGIGEQPGWEGFMDEEIGWQVLKSESEPMPEPKLRVRSRVVRVEQDVAERISAATTADRPVLISESLNAAVCPILVLPRIFMNTLIAPLYTGGMSLKPIEEFNAVEGWVTKGTPVPGMKDLFGEPPAGFIGIPATGRPLREATMQEVIPFA